MVKSKNHIQLYWKNYMIGILAVLLLGALFLQALTITSSGKSISYNNKETLSYDSMASGDGRSYYSNSGFEPETEQRMIAKNANIGLESRDYQKAKAQVQNSINAYDVLVLSQRENKYKDDYRIAYYNLRVESQNLKVLLDEFKSYGEVENLNIYANDITGTYTDYSQRLKRYKSQIEKYENLLDEEEITVEEEIKVQSRIDQLEDQIFYMEDRLENLDDRVDYSQVSLTLKEKPSVIAEADFFGLRDGFKLFMESLEAGLQFILLLVGFLLPFGVIYGIYRLVRRFRVNH